MLTMQQGIVKQTRLIVVNSTAMGVDLMQFLVGSRVLLSKRTTFQSVNAFGFKHSVHMS